MKQESVVGVGSFAFLAFETESGLSAGGGVREYVVSQDNGKNDSTAIMTTTRICGGEDLLGEERGGGREGEHRRPPDAISDERRDYLLLYRAPFLRPWMIGRFRRLCDERLLGLLITKRRLLQAKHRVSMDRLLAFCCYMDTDCRCWPYSSLQRYRPRQRSTAYPYEM